MNKNVFGGMITLQEENNFSRYLRQRNEQLYAKQCLQEASLIIEKLDIASIETITELLVQLRQRGGRLFLVGVGCGAGHASHAVNDFRKLANIKAFSPADNIWHAPIMKAGTPPKQRGYKSAGFHGRTCF